MDGAKRRGRGLEGCGEMGGDGGGEVMGKKSEEEATLERRRGGGRGEEGERQGAQRKGALAIRGGPSLPRRARCLPAG